MVTSGSILLTDILEWPGEDLESDAALEFIAKVEKEVLHCIYVHVALLWVFLCQF